MRPRTRSEIFELKEKPLELGKNGKDDPRGISKPCFPSTNNQRVKSLVYVDEEEVVDTSSSTSTSDNNTTETNKTKEPTKPSKNLKGSLYHFATFPHDFIFLIPAFVAALLSGAAKPAQAMLIGKVFTTLTRYSKGDYTTPDEFLVAATRYCVVIIGLGAAGFFFDWTMLTCFDLFSTHSLLRARRKVFVRFMTRDFAWYDANSGIMGTLTTLNRCFGDFQGATSMSLALVCQACATIIASFCFSFYYSWAMTLVSLCMVPLMLIVSSILSRYMSRTYYQFKAITEDAGSLVDWAITSLTTVKQFNGQSVVFDRFVDILKRGSQVYFLFSHYAGLQQGLSRFLVLGMFVPMFVLGTFLVHKGKIESGVVVTVFSCMFMISGAFSALGMRVESLRKGQVAVAKLKHFLDLGMSENTYFKNMIGMFPPYCKGSITFQNVVFRYPSRPDIKVLDRVNLDIPAGETVFLVGSSGSGKSTISNIILRMYDITAGVILIDGSPLPSLNTKWLCDNITVVEQQSVLFNTSIADNIKLGRPSKSSGEHAYAVTPEELKLAIDFALLAPVIESTDRGLDTIVGVGGSRLSGGQRQRVALARARIRDTPILILDESVSALDARARARVMQAVRTWRTGRTTIIITHELSQIGNDEKYYMLADGRVVEEGHGRDLHNGSGAKASESSPLHGAPISPASRISSQSIDPFSDRYEVSEDTRQRRRSMPVFDNFDSTELSKPSIAAVSSANTLRNTTVRYSKFVRNSMLRPQSALFFVPPVPEPYHDDNEYDLTLAMMNNVVELPPLPATPDIGVNVNGKIQSTVLEVPQKRTVLPRPLSSPPDYFTSHRSVFGHEEEFVAPGDRRAQAKKKLQAIISMFNINDPDVTPSRYHKYISASEASNYKVSTVHILFMCYKRVRSKGLLWLGVILSIINGGLTPLFSSVVARLITYMVTPVNPSGVSQSSYPTLWIALALTLALVDGLTTYGRTVVLGYVADQWVCDMRDRALRMVLLQDVTWHTQNRIETNDLTALIISHSEEIRTILTVLLAVTVTTISLSFICVIWVLVVSWRLCFIGMGLASLYYFAAIFSKYVVIRWEGKCIHLNALLEEHIHETVSGIRTLRILGLERLFVRRFDAAASNLRVAKIRDSFYSGIGFGLNGLISYGAQGLLLWYGMKLIADETYPSSKVLMVYSILFFSISSISTLLAALPQMHTTFAVCFRLFQILDFDPNLTREHSGEQLKVRFTDGKIEFCDLYFSYLSADDNSIDFDNGADRISGEEEQDPIATRRKITKVKALFGPQLTNNKLVRVLESFSATIPARKTTAIIGPSGSGKSTLVALLTKLYAPTGGRIIIDGMDLQTLDTNFVRQDIAVVGQMPLNFFDGTIYENIVFALPDNNVQSLEAVRAVCRNCAIDEFISSLPEGYNTRIGGSTGPVSSGGTSLLSGGQMQRIGIARAIIRNPKILILDECTSGLDQVSTDAIKRTLCSLSGRMTVLIITHQANVASIADFVIKVAEGRRVSYQPDP